MSTSPATSAPTSAYDPSLPSPRLPLESLHLIIDQCDEPIYWVGLMSKTRLRTLAALCRVSRHFAQRVQPLLFKRIVLEYPFNLANVSPAHVQLLDALEENTRLAAAVQAFDVDLVSRPCKLRMRRRFKSSHRRRFQLALRSLPNVHTVTFRGNRESVEKAKVALWNCVPDTTRDLDLLRCDITPAQLLGGYDIHGLWTYPLLIVPKGHATEHHQFFAARNHHNITFVDALNPRSPYLQPAT